LTASLTSLIVETFLRAVETTANISRNQLKRRCYRFARRRRIGNLISSDGFIVSFLAVGNVTRVI
jgi:hypothetical protein